MNSRDVLKMCRTWHCHWQQFSALALCRINSQGIRCTQFLRRRDRNQQGETLSFLHSAILSRHGYRKVEIPLTRTKDDLRQYLHSTVLTAEHWARVLINPLDASIYAKSGGRCQCLHPEDLSFTTYNDLTCSDGELKQTMIEKEEPLVEAPRPALPACCMSEA